MKIQVLGTGCSKCKKLYAAAQEAAGLADVEAEFEKVEKLDEIIALGVAVTPALVIDGNVKSAGRVPKPGEIVGWIEGAARTE